MAQGRGCEGPACAQPQVPGVLHLPAWVPAPFRCPVRGFRLSAGTWVGGVKLSAPCYAMVWLGTLGFCIYHCGPDSHHPGRTSRRPARDSATGAARESWYPSCRASSGSTGPASRAPLRTGPASYPRPASSSCPARARGVSLPGAEDAPGWERPGAPSAGRGRRAGWGKDGGEAEKLLGHLERAGPKGLREKEVGLFLGMGHRPDLGRREPLGRRLSTGWALGLGERGLEAGPAHPTGVRVLDPGAGLR